MSAKYFQAMSKVAAFICDYKNHLVSEEKAVGINPVEDLFDKVASYPTVMNPNKAKIHYCVECYNTDVIMRVRKLADRKDGEDLYKTKLKELAFALRSQTVHNHWSKNRNKKSGK